MEASGEMSAEDVELPRNCRVNSDYKHSPVYHIDQNPIERSMIINQKLDSSTEDFHGTRVKIKNKVKLREQHDILSIKSHQKSDSKAILSESNSRASDKSIKSCFDYKYMVLIASFLSYMLAALLSSCFGVFFETMEADLGWSKGQCAFVGALLSALNDLAGPISSALTNRYGCRKTTIFGGLIAAFGVIGSAYVEDFWLLSFLLGGVSGFGSSLVLVASVVVVTYYFEDKPSLAAGLTISGASFGQSIFTMIIIKLDEEYGRSGCFLILGGILLNIVVCGALFRPLQWELEDDSDEESESSSDESESSESSSDSDSEETLAKISSSSSMSKIAPIASNECFDKQSEHLVKPEITFTDNYLVNSVSIAALKSKGNRPKLTKTFSSDTCLDYKNMQSSEHDNQDDRISLRTNYEEIFDDNEGQSAKFADQFSNGKVLEKHRSLQVFNDMVQLKIESDVMFSKSARSLNMYKSFLSYARRDSKLSDECDLNREQLEKAGFFVVDADELVDYSSEWNSQNGIFFPFITSEDNFKDKINVRKSISLISKKTRSRNESECVQKSMNDDMQNKNDDNTDKNQINFTQLGASNNSNFPLESSKNSSFFSKFSEFFNIRLNKNPLNTSIGQIQKQNSLETKPILPASTQLGSTKKSSAPKNSHHLFIKPVRTAQNGQRFIIARCTCQSLDKQVQRINQKRAVDMNQCVPNISINMNTRDNKNEQSQNTPQTPKPSYLKASSLEEKKQTSGLSQKNKSPKYWRHSQNCPVTYLNRLKNIGPQATNQPHIHGHLQKRQNSFSYVSSVFPNSYRFPLHFKNVYYYKSLINLNMRLMHLKSTTNNQPAHIPTEVLNLNVKTASNLNNLSLSCPDLNLNQVLLINSSDKKLIPLNSVNKPLQNKLLQQKLIPADGKNSKIINGGNIMLNKPIGDTKTKRGSSSGRNKKKTLEEKTLENTIKNAGLSRKIKSDVSLNSLKSYNDKIYAFNKSKAKIIDESSSSSSSEDESSSSDEDSSDNECAEFLKKTQPGSYFYKYFWRPAVQPLKYIYYSISESLKLFYLFKFCVFALCNFILSFFYEAPFYFINSYMIENDLSHNEAGTVTVAVGIVCIFASIAYGYFGDSKKINSIIMYSVSLILCGVCCCLIPPFIKNYFVTMILMTLIGALISVSDVLVPIICVNIVGYDDFVNAYGLMFFCQGLASLSGPPLLGIIVDYKGFDLVYYIMGVGIILSGLILTLILGYNKIETKKKIADGNSKEFLSLNV